MPEPTPLQLVVGDRVVYPKQGVCRVSSIETKEVAGQRLTFVTMKREEDGAVVMVPEPKVRSIGLRKVASSKEVTAIFDFLRSDSDKATLDWKQRARANLDRMVTGGLMGLAEVVKGLQVLSELRPLPAKERELYDNARHLLVAEISASLNVADCDAEDSVDLILFPPGRERPKRTAEEFRQPGEEDESLGDLGDEMLELGGDLDLPPEEEPQEAEEEPSEEEAEPPKRAAKEAAAPKKRGRPPKPKPAKAESEPPKKRGRPPKPQSEKAAKKKSEPPKKRGRPPKAK
jgi:RNA polymerase-interacting CarD/CdnL/TRCF family regulator